MTTLQLPIELATRLQTLADKKDQTAESMLLTWLEHAESELEQSEQLPAKTIQNPEKSYLQGILDSQIDLVCRYTPETILTYANDAYCQFFGKTRSELIGTSFLPLGTPAQIPAIYARIAEVVDNPAPAVQVFASRVINDKKRWTQWVDFGITDENGTVTEIQAVGRDVTDLIETQQALAENEELLLSIFETIPILLAQINRNGKFIFVNQHWVNVLGWTLAELPAHVELLSEFYPDPHQREEAVKYIDSVEPGWRDFTMTTKAGKLVDVSWANVRLSDGSAISIGVDITSRKHLELQEIYSRQLELELEKERELIEIKNRFISMVTHEFRTPLAVMKTSVDLITRYYDRLSQEQIAEKFSMLDEQIKRMVYMMEDVLSFSKITTTAQAPLVEIDVRPFFHEIINTFQLINEKNQRIVLNGMDGLLRANPQQLDHVFSNLVSNALKYLPGNTTITVSAYRDDDIWRITIQDEGIGIPDAELVSLFEPFQRASNVRDIPGTGLGLSIVKDYIEKHNGTIAVESTLGKGTLFTVTLPA